MPLIEAQPDALAEIYARSLFELAEAAGGRAACESAVAELEAILELARADARFSEFLSSRVVPVGDRAASLERILKGRIGDLTLRFLLVLNHKGRLGHLPAIAAAYDGVVQHKFGRVEVDLYTASPVASEELRSIKDQLHKALGREPVVHPYTDNAMLGGVKLQIGDLLIDASLATRLRQVRDRLASDGAGRLRARFEHALEGADLFPAAPHEAAAAGGAAAPTAAARRGHTAAGAAQVRMPSGANLTGKKNIHHVDVGGKRVLVRVDFNVPIEDGEITDDRRIREALPTILSVVQRGGRAVLISHLGRPEGTGYEAEHSLAPAAQRLSELLGRAVAFPSKDCTDNAAAAAVAQMKNGDIVLLENLRFHKGEKKGDAALASRLASYGDVYCNDAFGTCHRADASMVATPKAMAGKPRVVGFLVEKEIKFLSETLRNPASPFVVVLGGAKVSDKIGAIKNLLPKADAILVGGAMAYTFLQVLGRRVGESRVETEHLREAKAMIEQAERARCELYLPKDHVCSTMFAESTGDIQVFQDNIRDGYMGLDIGPATQSEFAGVLARAKTIVWNGPMGVFEWAPFRVGTEEIARAISQATGAGAVSIVGGGDTAAAAEKFGFAERMTHVSTGGGASLEMLEGKKFESVELLDNA